MTNTTDTISLLYFINENLDTLLTNAVAIVALIVSVVIAKSQNKSSTQQKLLELRLDAFNEFLKIFDVYPTEEQQTNNDRALMLYSYHRVIILTLPEHRHLINDFYSLYVDFLDNPKPKTFDNRVHKLAITRNKVIELFSKIILSCAPIPPLHNRIKAFVFNIFKR